jgi:hypothetical protein
LISVSAGITTAKVDFARGIIEPLFRSGIIYVKSQSWRKQTAANSSIEG